MAKKFKTKMKRDLKNIIDGVERAKCVARIFRSAKCVANQKSLRITAVEFAQLFCVPCNDFFLKFFEDFTNLNLFCLLTIVTNWTSSGNALDYYGFYCYPLEVLLWRILSWLRFECILKIVWKVLRIIRAIRLSNC